MKEEYIPLTTKGLSNVVDFSDHFHAKWVRYLLTRVHDQFLWLETQASIKITKDVIRRVTRFTIASEALTLRTISSSEVIWLTKSRCDIRAMTITHIEDVEVRLALQCWVIEYINEVR